MGNGRRRVVEALWRTVARDGMAGVSVRAVAAEAGLSGGTVQHHFPTRAEMVRYAMEEMAGQVEQRIAAMPRSGPPHKWTRAILLELLPLDAVRRREFSVWLAFSVHAETDPDLAELRARTSARLRELYQRIVGVRRLAAGGEGSGAEPAEDYEAAILHAVIDGIALQLADVSPDDAAVLGPALLDHYLARPVDADADAASQR
ncbi:TetR family transcriptional regulator C-terminal domain-containing protein [Georgenia sp. MJ173]|uniref:TetR/AcrR family transcriptional regulator n=1 Tax=Georgenia sunbinii TaxID=3117728 RepID=UPI002F26558E